MAHARLKAVVLLHCWRVLLKLVGNAMYHHGSIWLMSSLHVGVVKLYLPFLPYVKKRGACEAKYNR